MKPALRVATDNVNGVNGRLPRLLEWLRETNPDVVRQPDSARSCIS